MNTIKLSVYDPIVKAFREVTLDKEDAKTYVRSIKKNEKSLKEFIDEKNLGD